MTSPFINSSLNYTCNKNLLTRVFPSKLKLGIIRPLLKKGNNNNNNNNNNNTISNYRPISILTCFKNVLKSYAHWTAGTAG